MMVHQDASTHRWVADAVWDLVVTLDDATGEHTSNRRWQAQEGGHRRLHAQAADHPKRHAPGPGSMECCKACAMPNLGLTSKTVADPLTVTPSVSLKQAPNSALVSLGEQVRDQVALG